MKKSITLLLALSLILGLFAFASGRSRDEDGEDRLSVCVVVSSAFGDRAFNDSARDGAERLKERKEVDVSYIECENSEYKQKMMDAADEADIVVAVGWECYEIEEVAPEYPDKHFIWVDNVSQNVDKVPNLACITYAQNEGAFLAGYIAAKMSHSGVIGVLTGDDSENNLDLLAGYQQGAAYANPQIRLEQASTGDDLGNPALGKKLALELAEKGADVIFNAAGDTGSGIYEAAQERSFYAIGVNSDHKLTYPEYDTSIICSLKKDIGQSVYDTVVDFLENGNWNGGRAWKTDMATGYISIGYGDANSKQQVSEVLKTEISAVTSKIINGEIVVDDAKTVKAATENAKE